MTTNAKQTTTTQTTATQDLTAPHVDSSLVQKSICNRSIDSITDLPLKLRRYSSRGYLPDTIAQAIGLPISKLEAYLEQGRKDLELDVASAEREAYVQYKMGESENEMSLLDTIQGAGSKDWRASSWLLERTKKDKKYNYTPESITTNNTTITKYDNFTDDQLNQYLIKLLEKSPVIDVHPQELTEVGDHR